MPKKLKKQQKVLVKPEVYRTIAGLFLATIGVLVYVSYFQASGSLTSVMNRAFATAFGGMKYVFPSVVIMYGALLLKRPKDREYLWIRSGALAIAFVTLSGMYHLIRFESGEVSLQAAQNAFGGGLVGYGVAQAAHTLFGRVGGVMFGLGLFSGAVIVGLNIPIYLDRLFEWVRDSVFTFSDGGMKKVTEKSQQLKNRASAIQDPRKLSGQVLDEDIERLAKRAGSVEAEVSDVSKTPDLTQNEVIHPETSISQELTDKKTFEESIFGTSSKSKKEVDEGNVQSQVYVLPDLGLLTAKGTTASITSAELKKNARIIKDTLLNFGIEVEMGDVDVGPTVTRYMLRPNNGIKLSRITALQNDIALALAAQAIRIEAPIPGMSFVGIEIPNKNRGIVRLREVLEGSNIHQSEQVLPLALGKDVRNHPIMFPLEKMPHLLIAGATGAGKSMGLNAMILSLLYKNTPDTLRFIFVDPKRVELSTYNGIPHLLTPAIVQPDKALNALIWCVQEMERRYEKLAEVGTRNIFTYQEMRTQSIENEDAEPLEKMPFIVIIIDELADLMTTHKKEVEASIVRIAQMARAVGMHLILATQRPSTDVITGLIKANLPSRASYQVASQIDSRTILDMAGAEKLLGRGDMLFVGGDLAKPQRVQGPFVPEEEVKKVVDYWKSQSAPDYFNEITESETPRGGAIVPGEVGGDKDPLFDEAKELVMMAGKASSSMIQRRLKVGYARAARILDELEMAGVVGAADGSKPRDVLVQFDDDSYSEDR
jgi:S-DNA-T family DNA segregation ATPase FtsK/SpoIIIE